MQNSTVVQIQLEWGHRGGLLGQYSCADPVRGGVGWTPMVGQYSCADVQLYSCADPVRAGWCWLDNRAQQEGRGCQASRPVRGQ